MEKTDHERILKSSEKFSHFINVKNIFDHLETQIKDYNSVALERILSENVEGFKKIVKN